MICAILVAKSSVLSVLSYEAERGARVQTRVVKELPHRDERRACGIRREMGYTRSGYKRREGGKGEEEGYKRREEDIR